MKRKKSGRKPRVRKPDAIADRSAEGGEEPLPPEVRRALRLTGDDPDADLQRAADVGEEAVGGTVAMPDQDRVDSLGDALGVPRAPDEEVRTSTEILEGRDRHRWEQEP